MDDAFFFSASLKANYTDVNHNFGSSASKLSGPPNVSCLLRWETGVCCSAYTGLVATLPHSARSFGCIAFVTAPQTWDCCSTLRSKAEQRDFRSVAVTFVLLSSEPITISLVQAQAFLITLFWRAEYCHAVLNICSCF